MEEYWEGKKIKLFRLVKRKKEFTGKGKMI
jgi:hypothetical protein